MLRQFVPTIFATSLALAVFTPQYTWAAVDEYGLKLSNGGGTSLVLNNTTRSWGYRFTATESITVDRALTNLTFASGAPNLQVAIQADDGFGNPSGINLGSGSIVPGGAGYQNITISPTALNAGTVYHLLHSTPNGDGSNLLGLRTTGPGFVESHASTGTPEANYGLMLSNDTGSSWSLASTADVVSYGLYNSSTNDAVGQPYAFGNFSAVGGNNWRGQSFTYTGWGPGNVVDSISMRIYKGSASVGDDLRACLIDTTTNAAVWSDVLLDNNAPVTSGNGDIVSVAVPNVPLVNGRQYILTIESTGSANGAYEMAYNISDAPSPLLEENFQEFYASQLLNASSPTLPPSFSGTDAVGARSDAVFFIHTTVPEPASLSVLAFGTLAVGIRRSRR